VTAGNRTRDRAESDVLTVTAPRPDLRLHREGTTSSCVDVGVDDDVDADSTGPPPPAGDVSQSVSAINLVIPSRPLLGPAAAWEPGTLLSEGVDGATPPVIGLASHYHPNSIFVERKWTFGTKIQ